MSVFYLEVFFSRQARFYQLFQLMFFLSLYLLYKSKEKPKYIYLALISFFIALDTQIEALILAPFFIWHILFYSKKWRKFLAILPTIPLVTKFISILGLTSSSTKIAVNYIKDYISYTSNITYLLILFIPGLIWSFIKKKKLTAMIILPSIITLIGVFSLETFALRYSYFLVFPIILFSSLLISYLYDRYGKVMIVVVLILLLIPSSLFFQYTYVNVIKPINYNLNDYSAPSTNYKNLPNSLLMELRNSTIISYFSSDVEWYIKKPNYVLPFSLDGIGDDEVSMNNSKGQLVDMYSGAPILTEIPDRPYYLIADAFSVSKLKPNQAEFLANLTENCNVAYNASDVRIYNCS